MCENTVTSPSIREAKEDEIRRIVEESGADVIIHTAAISDIGACQANPDASYHANVLLSVYLAKATKDRKLICFSSDQVYSGCDAEGPYNEEMGKPANLYAKHKMEMEQRVLDICPEAVLLRAEWMYDHLAKRPNYFLNLLNAREKVSFSSKQYRGITYLKEVAENMEAVCRLPGGIYNFGSETTKSMYEITREFVKILGRDLIVEDAQIRHNLWMDCEKARKAGIRFSDVTGGLVRCLEDYKKVAQLQTM